MNEIEREQRFGAHNYAPLPVVLSHAKGVWVWDVEGNRYLDMMSAYSAVSHGHAHPRLVAALTAQAQRLAVVSRAFYTDRLGAFLERLCDLTTLGGALPMNTGAEAVETAIKAARRWGYSVKRIPADKAEIIVADGNFHGRTTTIVGFSSEPAYRADFGPFAPGFVRVPFGDIDAVRAAITPNTCAVLFETIQGEGGIVIPPDGFLRALRQLCTEHNVLMLLDEIQSGLGRTGRWFAYQHENVVPDGVMLGKALGGGLLPVSAFVARRDIIDLFEPGSHGSTFGGNALAATVALEALDVMADEDLPGHSAEMGEYLLSRLRAIHSPLIREVRGRGLWAGIEIDPARADAHDLSMRMLRRRVLAKETRATVLRLAPPLVIERAEIDTCISALKAVLAEAENETQHQA
ncbi:ornithine--oxo-acid transaminase [Pandoraea terrigena]|uniref:ornithine aminotransferase n=1 Tax=Pandoraea terrigena TaxID=2508292 RepID=A0A5E4SQJ8_9BURK|nr:ornithine--oxo-acid transaminase [Pandoraea terrigena]VVD78010.1 Ornithine aminotransferase 2 [Pandoraea terrigena]